MPIKMRLNDIKSVDIQISKLKMQRIQMLRQFVDDHCPVKLGQIIPVQGYSYKGKQMMVDGIECKKTYTGYKFLYQGNIIKKNGRVGENYTSFSVPVEEG